MRKAPVGVEPHLPKHMASFRTEFNFPPSSFKINHASALVLTGSCFSENIGRSLTERKFKVLSNPYGILFNPRSIARSVNEIIEGKIYGEKDLVLHNGVYHSMQHHSRFSGTDKNAVLQSINSAVKEAGAILRDASFIFITVGTAIVYRMQDHTVGNCHKMPGSLFEKKMLSVNEVVDCFDDMIVSLQKFNSGLQIVFTLSPVRHLKEGFEENQVSKSVLRAAMHESIQKHTNVSYFPAYELVMDDLRDYRFYDTDMVHPSAEAVYYVWQKFAGHYFDEKTKSLVSRIEQLNTALAHRPHFPESDAHLKFAEKLKFDIEAFEKETGISF
jgi:hypothetical protein